MTRPYYQDDAVTIYHGDANEFDRWSEVAVVVMDPPYGIDYRSGKGSEALARSIAGDKDTTARDLVLERHDGPALVFGTWRIPRPTATHTLLVWDKKGALGMGDLSIPWKPAHEEVYVIGHGFSGHRGSDVLSFAPVQSMAKNGRIHPHEKPVDLMMALIAKCPPGLILDPFTGTGPVLAAAKRLGRQAVGIEVDEGYCEMAAERCGGPIAHRTADAFDFGGAS